MQLEARQSIYNTAINAFGAGGVNTNMYVSVFVFRTFYFVDSLNNFNPFCLHAQVQHIPARANFNEQGQRQQKNSTGRDIPAKTKARA